MTKVNPFPGFVVTMNPGKGFTTDPGKGFTIVISRVLTFGTGFFLTLILLISFPFQHGNVIFPYEWLSLEYGKIKFLMNHKWHIPIFPMKGSAGVVKQ